MTHRSDPSATVTDEGRLMQQQTQPPTALIKYLDSENEPANARLAVTKIEGEARRQQRMAKKLVAWDMLWSAVKDGPGQGAGRIADPFVDVRR